MMVAVVIDSDRVRHAFATWAQAEAFALAVGRKVRLTSMAAQAVRKKVKVKSEAVPIRVHLGGAEPHLNTADGGSYGPTAIWSIAVGSDWLDANLGGES